MKNLALLFLGICLFISCSEKRKYNKTEHDEIPASDLSGNELAAVHCARCHIFVSPNMLPKSIWKNDVLPSMGHRLGIFEENHLPDSLFIGGASIIKAANIYPEKPVLALADWTKIVDYYVKNAPDSIVSPQRGEKINAGLKHFRYRKPFFSEGLPLTTMIKILPDNRGIVYSDAKRNVNNLTFLTPELKKNYQLRLETTPIHYYEKSDTIYLTTIGASTFPHDTSDGILHKVFKKGVGKIPNTANASIPGLQRPAFMAYGDLSNDGLEDIVACEYGNLTGQLVVYNNTGGNTYSKKILRSKPGAITAIIKDFNADGFKDILALMAQGDEGIFLYENNDGYFTERKLLAFSPLNGSQYIELADFNGDGFEDIIYVCGDNADRTPILKDYHGVYIYLNDGKFNFEQSYFYQLNGAYKAIPRDYDLDGDLDIAAISFFPDYYNNPGESFVYLENKGNLEFVDYSFPEATDGRWMVMDAGDMDADGDIDLALGSFVYFKAKGDTTGLGKRWLSTGPSLIVLENTIR